MSLVTELRRRQVFRAAAWYGGLAWVAVEVANTVFPHFGLPEWSVRAVIVAAVLGLPVALTLARAAEGYTELRRLQPRAVTMEPLWLMLRNDARGQQVFAAATEKHNAGRAQRSSVTPPAPAVDPPR